MTRLLVSFAGTTLAIEHEGALAARVVALLFARVAAARSGTMPKVTLRLRDEHGDGSTTLRVDDLEVIRTHDAGELAEHVHEHTAYHFADGCRSGLIVHAGAVAKAGRGLLFPGQSGSGKSTLTAWLMTRGFAHCSDELVHVSEGDALLHGWMRPVGLKLGSLPILEPLLRRPKAADTWLDTPIGAVLAPELLSPLPSMPSAVAGAVVFPRYELGRAAPSVRALSPAETAAWLLRCTINARHLPQHGLSAAATFCRRVPAVELVYGSFDGVDELLDGPIVTPR